jgi:magnesium-transporting ATPase (P-type)
MSSSSANSLLINPSPINSDDYGEIKTGRRFLLHWNILALFLFLFTVVLSQFWFQAFYEFYLERTNNKPSWWHLLLIAMILTLFFYLLMVYVFRIPFIAVNL